MNPTPFSNIAIIGAGAMGRGIAQIAAQSGCFVWLHDTQRSVCEAAISALGDTWERLRERGKLTDTDRETYRSRLGIADKLADLQGCDLVIEAVVERVDIKQQLFRQLEDIVSDTAVLATNTSSLSVTQIASVLKRPERFAGYHFFNPVPLMKVVEVIAGLRTGEETCAALTRFAQAIGHAPVRAGDTPGFIVNHAGRGYSTEALRILGERVSDVPTIDRILRDQAGFRLGPFELFDLTALDVSHPVIESIYHQYFEEPRYRPSVITAQRLAGGLLGRKVGEGFYRYVNGVAQIPPEAQTPAVESIPPVWVSPRAARRQELLQLLKGLGARIETAASPSTEALILVAPLGFDVTTVAAVDRLDPARTIGIDLLLPDSTTRRRVLARNPASRSDWVSAAHALFARDGKAVSVIRDSGGFVTQRVIATIVNIASDMCQQGVCSPNDLDTAVTRGLGYPQGPLALGDACGPASILEVLFNLQTVYGDPRYRPSPWLRRRGALGLSLLHTED